MSSSLVYMRPVSLACVRVTGSYEEAIPEAWRRMFEWLDNFGLLMPHGRGFGLARDNPKIVGAENCRYDACVTVTPQIEHRAIRDLSVIMMPGGSFARVRKSGCYSAIHSLVPSYMSSYEPPSGLHFDVKRPLVTIYLDDPRNLEPEHQRAEICIPVTAHSPATRRSAMRAVA